MATPVTILVRHHLIASSIPTYCRKRKPVYSATAKPFISTEKYRPHGHLPILGAILNGPPHSSSFSSSFLIVLLLIPHRCPPHSSSFSSSVLLIALLIPHRSPPHSSSFSSSFLLVVLLIPHRCPPHSSSLSSSFLVIVLSSSFTINISVLRLLLSACFVYYYRRVSFITIGVRCLLLSAALY